MNPRFSEEKPTRQLDWALTWRLALVLLLRVNSLHRVRPAAPHVPAQTPHVKVKLGQAELAEHPLVQAAVAARRPRQDLTWRAKQRRSCIHPTNKQELNETGSL